MYSIIDARNEFSRLDRMYGQDTSCIPIRFTNLRNSTERIHYKELPDHTYAPAIVSLSQNCITSSANLFYGVVHRSYAFVLSCLRDGTKHNAADAQWQGAYSDCKSIAVPARPQSVSEGCRLYMAVTAAPYKKEMGKKSNPAGMAYCLTSPDSTQILQEDMGLQPSSSKIHMYCSMLLNVLQNGEFLSERSNLTIMLPDTLFSAFLTGKIVPRSRCEENSLAVIADLLRRKGISLFFAEEKDNRMYDTVIHAFYSSLPVILTEIKALPIDDGLNDGVAETITDVNSSDLEYASLKKLRTGGKDRISVLQKHDLIEHISRVAGDEVTTTVLDVLNAWHFNEKLSLSALRWMNRGVSPAIALCRAAIVEPTRDAGGDLCLFKGKISQEGG